MFEVISTRRNGGHWEVLLNGTVIHAHPLRSTVETIADNLQLALRGRPSCPQELPMVQQFGRAQRAASK